MQLITVCLIAIATGGCKKFADVDPPSGSLTSAVVFTNANSVNSALSGMYSTMYSSNNQALQQDISVCPENSADETHFYTDNTTYDPFQVNSINVDNSTSNSIWTALYNVNYQANAIISGVGNNTSVLTDSVVKKAVGEAEFIRAFCHFYLVNLYGDVPLVLTTDAINNTHLPRTAASKVYEQIIADLTDAQSLLRTDYKSSAAGDRIRPNKYAATALLARAYLYTKDWSHAEAQATTVINATDLYSLLGTASIANTFLLNSKEAIFQMNMPSGSAYSGYTQYAWNYIYYAGQSTPWMVFTKSLADAFEPADQRFTAWVRSINYQDSTYYYPYKYKQMNITTGAAAEAYTYLRLAEQYLIRAEARAEQNNLSGAQADLNVIRNRAGLANTMAATQSDLLLAIAQERRVELFCEMGHRWYDLRRTGRIDAVLGASKPGWKSSAALYPIPQQEINNDINLTQNEGY